MSIHKAKSIHELPPLERGGVAARQGFEFQDHVAAGFLLDLLNRSELSEVWCETHDDVTLIWEGPTKSEVEFVQVKALTLNQLWSVPILTSRDKKTSKEKKEDVVGSSIVERSLANDRCNEPTRFRLVTSLPPNDDLKFLGLPLDAPDRIKKLSESADLIASIESRISNFRSENKNGIDYWLANTSWDVLQSDKVVSDSNTLKLMKVLIERGIHLFPDQVDELYAEILALARKAAVTDWGKEPNEKKWTATAFGDWLDTQANSRQYPHPIAGKNLEKKLLNASIPTEEISSCFEIRQRYLAERYTPQYLSVSNLQRVEGEVASVLHSLRANLDAGKLPDNGINFHAECLTAINQLQSTIPENPPLPILQGCMYSIADRCIHRFRRASV